MKIGDKVISKNKTGKIRVPGKLVGIIDPNFYINKLIPPGFKLVGIDTVWSKTCPNWKNENIAIVLFETPQKTATLEEWVESGMATGLKKEDLEKDYEKQCPEVTHTAFPIKDLKIYT